MRVLVPIDNLATVVSSWPDPMPTFCLIPLRAD